MKYSRQTKPKHKKTCRTYRKLVCATTPQTIEQHLKTPRTRYHLCATPLNFAWVTPTSCGYARHDFFVGFVCLLFFVGFDALVGSSNGRASVEVLAMITGVVF